MKVFFVRHGQSVGNVQKIHQDGWVILSDHGEAQATSVAERFTTISVDKIFSSDYTRAHKTALAIGAITNQTVVTTPLLREVKRPSELEGKKIDDPVAIKIRQEIAKHRHDPNWRYSDEETFTDIKNRVNQLLAMLSNRKEDTIACVAHGNIIRFIAMVIMIGDHFSLDMYDYLNQNGSLWLENTGITVCEYRYQSWSLMTWNDYAHLGD